ncbi:MAG TPA: helix-turn-helix domain-containing protein [Candidatus Sulfotelmatobacter sp.]|nr:helix-turn-helix domain-containing protein [Candidatus Sulfotelmatobacter sp.]
MRPERQALPHHRWSALRVPRGASSSDRGTAGAQPVRVRADAAGSRSARRFGAVRWHRRWHLIRRWRAQRYLVRLGEEIRQSRIVASLSQQAIADALGCSQPELSRIERARLDRLSIPFVARYLAAVGLDLSIRAYPGGPPLRDRAHVALLSRFRQRLDPRWRGAMEAPVAPSSGQPRLGPPDPRRWDLVLRRAGITVGVEAETRLFDAQGQVGRALGKRDAGAVDRLVLLVADTRHNRSILREIGPLFQDDFPMRTRAILHALGAGDDPGADGIAVL